VKDHARVSGFLRSDALQRSAAVATYYQRTKCDSRRPDLGPWWRRKL